MTKRPERIAHESGRIGREWIVLSWLPPVVLVGWFWTHQASLLVEIPVTSLCCGYYLWSFDRYFNGPRPLTLRGAFDVLLIGLVVGVPLALLGHFLYGS